ncbi:MAG TPA: hypothetical protein VIO11_05795 [Candidatus Methanoperedens sp.]
MIKLVARWVRNFLWSEKTARASLRSFLGFWAIWAGLVIASASDATGHVNYQIIGEWDWRAWGLRFAVAAVTAAILRIQAGEKNPTTAEIVAAVKEAKP